MREIFTITPEEIKEEMIKLGFEDAKINDKRQEKRNFTHPTSGYTTVINVEGYVDGDELPEGSEELLEKVEQDIPHPDRIEKDDIFWSEAEKVTNVDNTKIGLFFEADLKV